MTVPWTWVLHNLSRVTLPFLCILTVVKLVCAPLPPKKKINCNSRVHNRGTFAPLEGRRTLALGHKRKID